MDGATVDFALTRFEAVDGARLEVEGTWSGVRGVRFVRPALVVHDRATGGEKTLLADLEHKPWPAQEGEPWVAAFPWKDGDEPDVARTELAVAPSIVVPLVRTADAVAVDRDPVDALRAELTDATERARRLEAEVAFLRREREEAAEARRAAPPPPKPDREAVRGELRQRDEALAARDAAVAVRDAALAERDHVLQERDALRRELRERDQIADGPARRREQALQERDAARRELSDAEERAAERERLRGQERVDTLRDALGAAEEERDRALAEPAGVAAPPVRVAREHGTESSHADWAARTAAILAVLVLLVLAITFLKAIA
ncbi:hypothetical protein [Baekduia alba]|uniref:hypothetical protein n=1 Tax=Baekduia alba TaxID=2997333 RepID=UPI002342682B|nr:hypothetical protein [Baekduia alba]